MEGKGGSRLGSVVLFVREGRPITLGIQIALERPHESRTPMRSSLKEKDST